MILILYSEVKVFRGLEKVKERRFIRDSSVLITIITHLPLNGTDPGPEMKKLVSGSDSRGNKEEEKLYEAVFISDSDFLFKVSRG